jgi:hypothetical protein
MFKLSTSHTNFEMPTISLHPLLRHFNNKFWNLQGFTIHPIVYKCVKTFIFRGGGRRDERASLQTIAARNIHLEQFRTKGKYAWASFNVSYVLCNQVSEA